MRAVRGRGRLAAVITTAVALLAPAAAQATVVERTASLSAGALSEFSQATALNATVGATTARAYDGSYSVRSNYPGGGLNAYARGHWDVSWQTGDDVWYGAAFYLPTGFKAAMQNEVALMRWDNWPSYQDGSGDIGGIVIWGSDKKARLKLGTYAGSTEKVLVGPFDVPEGRWFWIEVHQKLGTSGALSEVFLDGGLVGRTTAANTAGRTIERIRYGLVAQGGSSQTKALELFFDRARVGASQLGPIGGVTPTPEPTPTPTPSPSPSPSPTPAPNAAPTVALTSPVAGARFTRSLALAANASDDRGVARVEFRIDGKLVATDSSRPYAVSVNTRKLAYGDHTVTATAYDAAGLKASDTVSVTKGAALATATKAKAERTSARRARCATRTVRRLHGPRAAKRARACRRLAAGRAAARARAKRAALRQARARAQRAAARRGA
jgi:hypothetical protein